jgi:restriction system protein
LIAKRNGKTIVIQAKRYEGSVGNRAVQEVVGAIKFYGADEGCVITSGTFTSSAKALAQKNNVKLIDGHALRDRDFT